MPEPLAGDGEQGVRDGRRNRAEAEFAYSGDYPLARFLYLTVNHKPGSRLDDLRAEFVRFVFSREGQEVVVKDGGSDCVVIADEQHHRVRPPRPRRSVDTTAAGDSFNAAYIAARLQELSPPAAVQAK